MISSLGISGLSNASIKLIASSCVELIIRTVEILTFEVVFPLYSLTVTASSCNKSHSTRLVVNAPKM